ncbi:DUF4190 domain-containing protein [Nocardioides sp. Root140]|uniref:DUF4190 domain-containing protein n=1 Tax=Nocardioides sp. Root140 TaxID=1736460 RepID=UPI000701DDE1|nr:DUF4190 domain-containing protein [Nocardioides sp. Root140]KQY63686.1 hypothetical protein ASD30_01385 [Nocardioides sp. Root140]
MTQPPYPGSEGESGDQSGSNDLPPTHQPYGQKNDPPAYGGDQPAYGQQPYGQQPAYGQPAGDPYGAWQGGNDAGKGTDGLSITAFVLSIVCCFLGIVAVILGIIGLGRTKNGQRKGRWAAVTAIILGIIGQLAAIGIGIAIFVVARNTVTLDNAEVGQCVNVDKDGDSVMITKKDCSDDHDAQIVHVGKFEEVENSGFMPSNADDVTDAGIALGVCSTLVGDQAATIEEDLDGKVEYGIANEDNSPSSDEKFLCYVGRSDDEKLDKKIG